ncbi:MAG: GntR family transcriptional regulator [Bacillota bacterium]|nr:MAG: GntR family transcriptional regulator [Bacillota bacterium]MBS3950575.1 GntR family transcriptional regulator [Peptococcaceae bacterium]
MVAIELSRKSGIPLYVQLKERIRQQVESGSWVPGFKLPTERELSSLLGVSRNTVSQAYRELENEGILISLQGKGTFVSEADATSLSASRIHRLEEILELAISHALREGFSCDEFSSKALQLAQHKQQLLNRVKIVFIECNREQVDYFSKQLELGSGVTIAPLVVDELRAGSAQVRNTLNDADIVVTTFFHEAEVRRAVGADKRVLAVALDPQLETVVRIARVPRSKRLGLVCISTNFAEKVKNSICQAGIDHVPLASTLCDTQDTLQDVLTNSDVILVSPGRKKEVVESCPREKEIIEFVYRPDLGSVNLLKSTILELRERGV